MQNVQSLSTPLSPSVEQLANTGQNATMSLELTDRELFHLLRLVLIEMKSESIALTYRHRLHLLAEKMRVLSDDSEDVEDLWDELVGEDLLTSNASLTEGGE